MPQRDAKDTILLRNVIIFPKEMQFLNRDHVYIIKIASIFIFQMVTLTFNILCSFYQNSPSKYTVSAFSSTFRIVKKKSHEGSNVKYAGQTLIYIFRSLLFAYFLSCISTLNFKSALNSLK